MKGNIVIKTSAFNSVIYVLKSFYTSLPPFSIVPQMYFNSSTGFIQRKSYCNDCTMEN